MFVRAYHHMYGFPIMITRSNNVYGPRQYLDKAIPRFIALVRAGDAITPQGDGYQLRSWIHVLDVCRGVRRVLERGAHGEAYNIATDFELSVRDVAETVHAAVTALEPETPRYRVRYVPDRPFNDKRYWMDCTKIHEALRWGEQERFEDGIRDTVERFVARPVPDLSTAKGSAPSAK